MYGGFEFDMSVDSYDKLIQLISGNLMSEASSFPVWGRREVFDVSRNRADLSEGLSPVQYQDVMIAAIRSAWN